VRIAHQTGAERYAADAFHRAVQLLQHAESMIAIHKERDTPQRKKTLAKPRKLPSMREIQPNSISETQQPLVMSSCPTRVVSELQPLFVDGGGQWPRQHNM
jgi:hypothetical protein